MQCICFKISSCQIKKNYFERSISLKNLYHIQPISLKPISYVNKIVIKDAEENHRNYRALFPDFQSNLITQELVDTLKLICTKHDEIISEINESANVARTTEVTFKSMYTDYKTIECIVLPVITGRIPQVRIKLICKPEGLKMTEFHTPGVVDLLLGLGIFWQLICKDSILQAKGMPTLQNTLLGWIVGGELINAKSNSPKGFCGIITNTELHTQLERFWNQEKTHKKRKKFHKRRTRLRATVH